MQASAEEQEHEHADLGEQADALAIDHQPDRRGPEQHARQDIADQRRLAQPRHHHAAEQGGETDDGDGGQAVVMGHDRRMVPLRAVASNDRR